MKDIIKVKILLFILGIFSIVLGSTYMFRMYGPTEQEVSVWGFIETIVGFLIVCSAFFMTRGKYAKIFIVTVMSINVFLQILPIILWFSFNETGISDGSPPSDFIASWLYSLPHITIGLFSLLGIVLLCGKQKSALEN